MPWFRMHDDAVDDEKLRLLAFEDRWHFVAICCLKNKQILDKNDPHKDRKIGVKLGLQPADLAEVKRRLMEVELINEDWQPIAWDRRQYKSDNSTERVRKHRQKTQKRQSGEEKGNETQTEQLGNVSETAPEAEAEAETETETPKDLHGQSPAPPVPVQSIVEIYHEILPNHPKCRKITTKRAGQIRQRWKSGDLPTLGHWRNYFEFVTRSRFLTGNAPGRDGRPPFIADIEWLTNESNFTKTWEQKYHGV